MKKLIFIMLALPSTFCVGQRMFYAGGTAASMKMTVHTRDTGNEMYPMQYWPSWPNYYGVQAGFQISPKFTVESGLQVVNYDETVRFKHHFYGFGNGMVAVNVPVTGIWNFVSHPLAERSVVKYGLMAGVNVQAVNGRNSSGGSNMGESDPNSFHVSTHNRSDEGPACFLRPFGGLRSEVVMRDRIGFFGSFSYVLGKKEVFTNHVEYSENGVKNTGAVAFTGGGRLVQFGVRGYFGTKIAKKQR